MGSIDLLLANGGVTGLMHLFLEWNIVLVILGCCSVLAVAVFIERLFHLRRAEIDTNKFIIHLRRIISAGNFVEAIKACEETPGSIARIIKSGLLKHGRDKEQIEGAMEMSGVVELANLEKNAKILSIIAHIAPLIGLLGTVLGFIQAFSEMRHSGMMDISATRIGEAMEYALVTTAAGLVIAIPTIVAYNYIVSRIESLVLEMQTTSSEVVDLLAGQHEFNFFR